MDWIDEILDDEPISASQISMIEGLLPRVPYPQEEKELIEREMLDLTYQEAYELILRLRQDHIPRDPREQFKKMFRDG